MSIYFEISAPAKLNLNLFVKDKSSYGLHFLESDICFLELFDKICIKISKDDTFYQIVRHKIQALKQSSYHIILKLSSKTSKRLFQCALKRLAPCRIMAV